MLVYFSPIISGKIIKMTIKLICKLPRRNLKILFEPSMRTISILNIGEIIYRLKGIIFNLYSFSRDTLKRNYLLGRHYLEVDMEDLAGFDEALADKLSKKPSEHLQIFEEAAKEVADEITAPRPENEEEVHDIQVLINSNAVPTNIRDLKSDMVSHMVKITGIIISASGIRAKTTKITIQCRSCNTTMPNIVVNPGLDGYALPRKCTT